MKNYQFLDKLRKVGKITLFVFGLLVFGLSLYFNYLYFKQIKASDSNMQDSSTIQIVNKDEKPHAYLSGKVISVNQNLIKVNVQVDKNKTEEKDIFVTDATTYQKILFDYTSKGKPEQTKFDDIKQDLQINVLLADSSNESSLVAKNIDIIIQNLITGTVESINKNSIKITSGMQFKIDNATSYYIEISKPDSKTLEPAKFDKISFASIKQGDLATIVLPDDFSNKEQTVSSIVIMLSK